MSERKKKPRPWDKPEEDIPDVIWGAKPKDFPNAQNGVLDPFRNLPLPQMDS